MSFLHDIIKIQLINIGYLPNTPYHLISDKEMFEAFYNSEAYEEDSNVNCFFKDYYYYPEEWTKYPELKQVHNTLREFIATTIDDYLQGKLLKLPEWIYSYMLMRPITFESDEIDIMYLYTLLDEPNTAGEYMFTEEIGYQCYLTSLDWIKRNPTKNYNRPPTIFGETHVTKSLRLAEANIFISSEGES